MAGNCPRATRIRISSIKCWPGNDLNAKRRLNSSLMIGFITSFALHIASAVTVALISYSDEPLKPKYLFIYLLLPGWAIAGRQSHVKLWQEILAAVINGAAYAFIVFCFLTWNAWRKANAPHTAKYRLVATVPFVALLWWIEAFFLGFFPNGAEMDSIAALAWALIVAIYALYRQFRP